MSASAGAVAGTRAAWSRCKKQGAHQARSKDARTAALLRSAVHSMSLVSGIQGADRHAQGQGQGHLSRSVSPPLAPHSTNPLTANVLCAASHSLARVT